MTSMRDLIDGYKDLIVGAMYEIYVPDPPYSSIEQRHITQTFKDHNIRYVKILEHTPVNANPSQGIFNADPFVYKVATYDDKLKEVPIRRYNYETRTELPPNEVITPKSKIRIVKQVGLSPSQKTAIGESELQKQRSAQTKQIIESVGLPSRLDSGPLGSILEYAGIKPEVRPRIKGGKSRRSKKSKRKTRKHK